MSRIVFCGGPLSLGISAASGNACTFSWHLLTVRMHPTLRRASRSELTFLMKNVSLLFELLLVAAFFPTCAAAQLVRESTTPPLPNVMPKHERQDSSALPTPAGKKRLSQEIQLTGDASWLDTVIEIQAAEHLLITATGNLRYADAKNDNGPEGLARGFKDLIRILPFNDAGRGALIGRIGDADT